MGNYGFKVARPGYDVKTAAEINLSLLTARNIFKIVAQGFTTMSDNSTLTINHALGYVPNFQVFVEKTPTASEMRIGNGSWAYENFRAYATTADVIIKTNTPPTGTYDVYYYIFIDPQ